MAVDKEVGKQKIGGDEKRKDGQIYDRTRAKKRDEKSSTPEKAPTPVSTYADKPKEREGKTEQNRERATRQQK